MDMYVAHKNKTGSEPGIVGGEVYALYINAGINSYRYYSPGNISPQAQAVKNWIARCMAIHLDRVHLLVA